MSKKLRHRKPCWYNTTTNVIHYSKPPKLILRKCLYFPSTSEFNLWLTLKSLLPVTCTVETQKYLYFSGVKWRIDFCLTTQNTQLLNDIAYTFNGNLCQPHQPLSKLFVEYKGIKDKNFLYKQRLLANKPYLDYSVVLVSSNEDAIFYGKLYKKRIVGLQCFKDTLRDLIK